MSRRERPEPTAGSAQELAEERLTESIEDLSDRAAQDYEDEMRRRW